MKNKTKPWYVIRGIEYSTSFDFFLQNQICVVRNPAGTHFVSRLEALAFQHTAPGDWMEDATQPICRQIHTLLLAGKYGTGTFTD